MEKDFQEGFSRLREVMAEAPGEPACLILHHLRKPKSEDRHKGRNLAHLLSGSYVLVSVSRSVMVMQPATDDDQSVDGTKHETDCWHDQENEKNPCLSFGGQRDSKCQDKSSGSGNGQQRF